jgi:hypothetical protein
MFSGTFHIHERHIAPPFEEPKLAARSAEPGALVHADRPSLNSATSSARSLNSFVVAGSTRRFTGSLCTLAEGGMEAVGSNDAKIGVREPFSDDAATHLQPMNVIERPAAQALKEVLAERGRPTF